MLDHLVFAWASLLCSKRRTGLMLLAMAIGVASVVMLTALGEGARRYVSASLSELGTHLLIVLPGRSETTGGAPPLTGETPRDLTLSDALALMRSPYVQQVAPVMVGSVPASVGGREREVNVIGTTAGMKEVRQLKMRQGLFLPDGDVFRAESVVVLGEKLKQELFAQANPLGSWIRLADRRFRVIGVLAPLGQSIGVDFADIALIPVASAENLLDSAALFRILVQARSRESLSKAELAIREVIRLRHEGEDDITVITQNALLSTFDRIFRILTITVGGIAAISLAVAGILIMNVMLVSVSQRTREIGVLKALGATGAQVMALFLVEATLLSSMGAAVGLMLGYGAVVFLGQVFATFPLAVPGWAAMAGVSVALASGLLFGWLPARRAARLDPVLALAGR